METPTPTPGDARLDDLIMLTFPHGLPELRAAEKIKAFTDFMRKAGYELVRLNKAQRVASLQVFIGSPKTGTSVQIIQDISLDYIINHSRAEVVEAFTLLITSQYAQAMAQAEKHGFDFND